MDLVPERPTVELRDDPERGRIVVLGFPYDVRRVDAVRRIPGRRFDWDAREWWAPVDDWAGGTRIGACLGEFNRRWSRRLRSG
jgi:uncharacterized protein with von Willebrand factor type A (vWA) domain